MTSKEITHHNHYVPQFYLQNWCLNNNILWVYNLLVSDKRVPCWSKKFIKSEGKWDDFYTRVVNDQEIDDFEKWFNAKFETPVKSIYEKLINDNTVSTLKSIPLSRYIAAQHLRTPAQANHILSIIQERMPQILDMTNQMLNNNPIPKAQLNASDEQDSFPVKVSIDRENKTIYTETVIGKSMYLYSLRHLLNTTVKVMYNYTWHVINAADGVTFPTTDDPVICLNYRSEDDYDFYGGWGLQHGNIIFPISPHKLLFTEIGTECDTKKIDRSLEWSLFFRKIIIEHAFRFIYDIEPKKDVLTIKPRIVDKELYKEEQQKLASWHDEHIKAERDLFNKSADQI